MLPQNLNNSYIIKEDFDACILKGHLFAKQ
jgi:hypothetical protein